MSVQTRETWSKFWIQQSRWWINPKIRLWCSSGRVIRFFSSFVWGLLRSCMFVCTEPVMWMILATMRRKERIHFWSLYRRFLCFRYLFSPSRPLIWFTKATNRRMGVMWQKKEECIFQTAKKNSDFFILQEMHGQYLLGIKDKQHTFLIWLYVASAFSLTPQ